MSTHVKFSIYNMLTKKSESYDWDITTGLWQVIHCLHRRMYIVSYQLFPLQLLSYSLRIIANDSLFAGKVNIIPYHMFCSDY